MARLTDIFLILALCTFSLYGISGAAPILAALAAVILACLIQLFSGKKTTVILIIAASLTCGIFPAMICTFPIILYEALWEKKPLALLPALSAIISIPQLTPFQIYATVVACIIAYFTYLRLSQMQNAHKKLITIRDNSVEKNMHLKEQNIRLAEAQDNAVRLATLRERNRIAREIHDNVGHMLTRSLLQSGALMIINKDENLKEPLESLKNTLDSAMTSIRSSVHDLYDESIDLEKIINDSISSVSERFNVHLNYSMSENVPGNIKLCIASIVKEALSNAVKHSDGDKISIMLLEHPGFYQLMIEDNGHPGKIKETGIGLKNMEERAVNAGGRITFTPSEKGFRIFMSIPKQ